MPRSEAYQEKVESPVSKYLSWSSNDKCFTYYDKEAQENKKVNLPIKLIHFSDFGTIKGFHDASNSGIYSNEVKSVSKEPLNVKAFKGGEIASGLYKDIKGKVNASGGVYNASIYGLIGNEIVNLSFKGASLQQWSEFKKEYRRLFLTNYILINSSKDMKKGSVKYSVPQFELGDKITDAESKKADASYDSLGEFFNYREKNVYSSDDNDTAIVNEVVATETEGDLLPF